MSHTHNYAAVITLDDPAPTSRADFLQPLLAVPGMSKVVLRTTGPVACPGDRVEVESCFGDERQTLLRVTEQEKPSAILRFHHSQPLRFPLLGSLLDQLLRDAQKQTPGGYHQLDLQDLPYPYLQAEVLGRDYLELMRQRRDVRPDWLDARCRHANRVAVQHSTLGNGVRREYLGHPDVEFYSFPKFVALESSRLCNLRCTMCVTHSDLIDHSHLERYPKHFDFEHYCRILDQLVPYRRYLTIAPQYQGEPFLSPHIKEMIRYAKRLGFSVGFTSNATLWTEELIRFMIEQQVDGLCVSLDGATKETFEQVRIGASYETVIGNIQRLHQLRAEMGSLRPGLQINMTLLPENRHELETLVGTWMGVASQISVNNACINHVVPEKYYVPQERYPCPFLWEGLHILTNGDVMACCRDTDYEEVMGNAYQTPLLDIWQAAKYQHFRELHRQERWDEVPICSRCDTWMCKTRVTLVEQGRLIVQHPFHRQYSPMPAVPDWNAPDATLTGKVLSSLSDLWGAVSDSGRALGGGLINLTVRSRS